MVLAEARWCLAKPAPWWTRRPWAGRSQGGLCWGRTGDASPVHLLQAGHSQGLAAGQGWRASAAHGRRRPAASMPSRGVRGQAESSSPSRQPWGVSSRTPPTFGGASPCPLQSSLHPDQGPQPGSSDGGFRGAGMSLAVVTAFPRASVLGGPFEGLCGTPSGPCWHARAGSCSKLWGTLHPGTPEKIAHAPTVTAPPSQGGISSVTVAAPLPVGTERNPLLRGKEG